MRILITISFLLVALLSAPTTGDRFLTHLDNPTHSTETEIDASEEVTPPAYSNIFFLIDRPNSKAHFYKVPQKYIVFLKKEDIPPIV